MITNAIRAMTAARLAVLTALIGRRMGGRSHSSASRRRSEEAAQLVSRFLGIST
jgi:hypothetical protein